MSSSAVPGSAALTSWAPPTSLTSSTDPVPSSRTRPQRFLALDGLRGIAALIVLLIHVRATPPLRWLAPHGFLAVDFFFTLSGFVIAHAYGTALASGALSPGQFILRRYVRLWPAAALGTAFGVLSVLFGQVPIELATIPKFVGLSLLLIPSIGTGGEFFPLDPPLWSLFDEIMANAAFGLGLFRLRFRGLASTTIIAGILTATMLVATDGAQWASAQRVVYPYLAGTLAYELRIRGVRCRSPRLAWSLAAATMLGLWVPKPWRVSEAVIFSTLVLVVFPLTVWACADLDVPEHLRRFSKIAGDLSYPLYSVHYPLLLVASAIRLNAALAVTAIVLLSLAIGRYYDLPLRRWLLRVTKAQRLTQRSTETAPGFGPTSTTSSAGR